MKLLRTVLFAASLLLLTGGYAASQVFYQRGEFADYAARVDVAPVRLLAAAIFACCLVFPFLRGPDEGAKV